MCIQRLTRCLDLLFVPGTIKCNDRTLAIGLQFLGTILAGTQFNFLEWLEVVFVDLSINSYRSVFYAIMCIKLQNMWQSDAAPVNSNLPYFHV